MLHPGPGKGSALKVWFRPHTLQNKLFIIILVVFGALALNQVGVSAWILGVIVRPQIEKELDDSTANLQNLVKASVDVSITSYLRGIAEKNLELVAALQREAQQGLFTDAEARHRAAELLLKQRIGTTGYIYALDGKGVIQVHPQRELRGKNLAAHAFIREQLRRHSGYLEYQWANPGDPAERPKALYMAYFEPWDWIISVSSYRDEFRNLVSVSDFRDRILLARFGETGYSYVLDGQGTLVVHPAMEGQNIADYQDSSGRHFIQEMLDRKNGSIVYPWRNPGEKVAREKLVVFRYLPEMDWIIASSSYLEEFHRVVGIYLWTASLSLFLTLAAALFCAAWIHRTIAEPLRTLTQKVAASSGEAGLPPGNHNMNEVEILAAAFEGFLTRIEHSNRTLIESEQRYHDLFANSLEGISQATPEGRILNANPALARALRFASPEALINTVHDLGHQFYVDPSRREQLLARLEREGTVTGFEAQWFRQDGSILWVNLRATAIRDNQGNLIRIDDWVEDITERKRVEDELRQVDSVQTLILDNSSLGIAYVKHRRFAWVNIRMLEILGRLGENLEGAEARILYASDEEYERIGAMAYSALMLGDRFETEILAQRADGTRFWARILGKALDATQPQEGSIWLFEDIQARRQAEEELRQVNRIQTLILDNSAVGISFVRNRLFEWVNPRVPEMLGLRPDQVLGAPTRIIYTSDEQFQEIGSRAYSALAEGRWFEFEITLAKATGGTFAGRILGKALDPARPQDGSIWIFEDITERKANENTLRQYQEHLEELVERRTLELIAAKELAEAATRAKSVFLANMSHELRTPLNAVIGYAQLLARKADDPDLRSGLGRILKAGEHLLRLINDVLSISKIESGRVNLNVDVFAFQPFLETTVDMLRPRALAKGLNLTLDVDADLPLAVRGDAQKLSQVLLNLLGNAVKFTDSGQVGLEVARIGGQFRFTVWDTGAGIPAELRNRLFQVFARGAQHETKEGAGLGLHISQALVHLMGGHLALAEGPGTRFHFEIALPEAALPPRPEAGLLEMDPSDTPCKLLIVDDVEDNRALLQSLFESAGAMVRVAGSGPECLATWQEWKPDAVWLDLRMPGMDGMETCRRLRQVEADLGWPPIVVVAVTASAMDMDVEGLRHAGFNDCVLKPIREEVLFEKLQTWLGVRFRVKPEIQARAIETPALSPDWTGLFLAALDIGDTDAMRAALQTCADLELTQILSNLLDDYRYQAIRERIEREPDHD